MTRTKDICGLFTNGEADWLITEWKRETKQSELSFVNEVFNLICDEITEPKQLMITPARRESAQMELF